MTVADAQTEAIQTRRVRARTLDRDVHINTGRKDAVRIRKPLGIQEQAWFLESFHFQTPIPRLRS